MISHLYPNSTPALNFNFKSSGVADPRISCARSTTGTYVDPATGSIETAAANEARVGRDGLLVEEARTNEQTNSEDFANNSSWSMKNSYTRGSNTTEPAPDGTNTACEFFEVNGAGQFNGVKAASMYQITATSGRLTVSVFNKPINNDTFMMMESDTTSGVANCTSIINNTWQYNSSFVESATAKPIGNGWYRMSATFIVPTSTQFYRPVFSSQMFSGPNETPDATQGCTLWGAQVEEGAFVTSYIPTSSSTVTRNSDQLSFTTAGQLNTSATADRTFTVIATTDYVPAIEQKIISTDPRLFEPDFDVSSNAKTASIYTPFTTGMTLSNAPNTVNFVATVNSTVARKAINYDTSQDTTRSSFHNSTFNTIWFGIYLNNTTFKPFSGHIERFSFYSTLMNLDEVKSLSI